MWPRFKCDSRQHHVMASANTEHYCDLSVFLPTSLPQTHTYKHTHTFLTWECCLRLNQCHACHISCQRSSLSSDLSPPFLVSFLYPLSLPSLSFFMSVFLIFFTTSLSSPLLFTSLSLHIPVSSLCHNLSAFVPPASLQTIQCGLTSNQTHHSCN